MSSIHCPYCEFELVLKGAKPGHYWPACSKCKQKFSLTIPLEGNPVAVISPKKVAASATLEPTVAPRVNATALPGARQVVAAAPRETSVQRQKKPALVAQGPELAGRLGGYDLKQKLGQGGMGAVYLARQISLDRDVALKVLAPDLAEDAEFVSRFTREAYAAAQLCHHNVVQIHDIGLEKNHGHETNFFSMEFVDGKTLSGLLKESGKLDTEAAVGYTLQAARGLKFAHDHGLIHRDVKPDNLLVNDQGVLKVADLGLVKRIGVGEKINSRSNVTDAAVTQVSMSMGTPAYMPPEQARDAASVDARADIYSLGCTLYDLLVGRPPFIGKTAVEVMTKHATEQAVPPDRLVRHVPGALSFIVMKMMAKRPDDRYQTMGQAIAALEGWLGVEPGKPFSPREEHVKVIEEAVAKFNSSKWSRLRTNLILAFCGLSVIAIAVLAFPRVGHPVIAGGLVCFVLTAVVIYQVIHGAANRSPLLNKLRLLIFTSKISDWLTWLGFMGLGILLLIAFDLQWVWLGFAIAAGVSAAVFYFAIDLVLAKHRQAPLADAENLLKEMRLRGLDENSLRQFVCKYSGHRWEEFYESLFGYDAKLQARQHWGRGERGRNRHKYAVWRESIIDWIERKLRHRRLERERNLLARLDAKAMTAQGVELNIANRKAKRNAERLVAKAAAVRETAVARSAQTALPIKNKPVDAMTQFDGRAIAPNWAHDDSIEVKSSEPHIHESYLKRRFGTPLDIIFGQLVRVVLGIAILVGFGLWWNQNAGAQARQQAAELAGTREEVTETAQKKDLTTAIKTFKGFGVGMKGGTPLRLDMVPPQITDAVGSWNGGLAGVLLIFSAFCVGRLLGFVVLLAAAAALFGERLQLRFIDGNALVAAVAACVLWTIGIMFFREQRSG